MMETDLVCPVCIENPVPIGSICSHCGKKVEIPDIEVISMSEAREALSTIGFCLEEYPDEIYDDSDDLDEYKEENEQYKYSPNHNRLEFKHIIYAIIFIVLVAVLSPLLLYF